MRLALLLPLLLLCGLSIAAYTSEKEARDGEDRAREFWVGFNVQTVNEQVPAKVQCPDDVDADEGGRYRCLVTASDGTSVAVNVVQPHYETSLTVTTKLLETRRVETLLRHRLNVGRPPEASVWLLDCQDLVEVKKGGRFTCKGSGMRDFAVRATFTNDRGRLSYTVQPS